MALLTTLAFFMLSACPALADPSKPVSEVEQRSERGSPALSPWSTHPFALEGFVEVNDAQFWGGLALDVAPLAWFSLDASLGKSADVGWHGAFGGRARLPLGNFGIAGGASVKLGRHEQSSTYCAEPGFFACDRYEHYDSNWPHAVFLRAGPELEWRPEISETSFYVGFHAGWAL